MTGQGERSSLLDAADWQICHFREGKVISVIDCPDLTRVAPALGKLYSSKPVIFRIPSKLVPAQLRFAHGESAGSSLEVMQKWFAGAEARG
jgi:hypothetical protein